jgi:hypothetical protein
MAEARNGKRFVLDHSQNPAHEVLINDYRIIIRAIAAAILFHERVNNSWDQSIQF